MRVHDQVSGKCSGYNKQRKKPKSSFFLVVVFSALFVMQHLLTNNNDESILTKETTREHIRSTNQVPPACTLLLQCLLVLTGLTVLNGRQPPYACKPKYSVHLQLGLLMRTHTRMLQSLEQTLLNQLNEPTFETKFDK